jgi:hypothetical protein
MNRSRLGTSVLIVSVSLVMGTSINQVVIAEEVVAESISQPAVTNEFIATSITPEKTETHPQPGTFSYNAADLLAKRPLDLNQLCKNYPLNSRCTERPTPSKPQVEEPKPTEEKSSETPKKTSGWAITPEISTLGVGATVTKSITPNINAKVGINGLGVSGDFDESGVKYNANLNLFNVSTLVDYHPWKNSGFRLTGGLVFQDNNAEGTGKASGNGTIKIGDTEYTKEQLTSVKAKVSLANSVAPYLGIGWGNAVKPGKHWGFSLNLGVMFAGSPKVDITPVGANPALLTQIQADIERERKQLENDLNGLNIYPVLSTGISYQF